MSTGGAGRALRAGRGAPAATGLAPGPAAADQTDKADKTHSAFQRLTGQLQALQAHVAAWQPAADAARARHATELLPLHRKLVAAQRALVVWLDAHLQAPPPGERLAPADHAELAGLLGTLAHAVLAAGDDAEVSAVLQRHGLPAPARDAASDAAGDHGPAGDADGGGVPGPSGPTPAWDPDQRRAERARQRHAKALRQAAPSVQAVYRRLAAALHPDREPDPAERERKTAWMARANQARDAQDLLTLLQLQHRLAADGRPPAGGAEPDRARHFIRVLGEQVAPLEAELAVLQQPTAWALRQPPGLLAWPPALAAQAVDQQLNQLRQALRAVRTHAELLRDARTRPAVLRALQAQAPDPDDADGARGDMGRDPGRGRGRRGRRG